MPEIIQIDNINQSQALIGNNDEHLKALEDAYDVVIHPEVKKLLLKANVWSMLKRQNKFLKFIKSYRTRPCYYT